MDGHVVMCVVLGQEGAGELIRPAGYVGDGQVQPEEPTNTFDVPDWWHEHIPTCSSSAFVTSASQLRFSYSAVLRYLLFFFHFIGWRKEFLLPAHLPAAT